MAAKKYIQIGTNGFREEVPFTQVSTGAADGGKGVALNDAGQLDITLLPTGIGADTIAVSAGEALTAGNFVYIDSTGKAYKADATAPAKFAIGFVLAGFAANATATVYFSGQNTQQTGLTVGSKYFLSDTTPGAASTTVVTTAGRISQFVGMAISATTIAFKFDAPITRA